MKEKNPEPKINMKALDAITRKVLKYQPPASVKGRKPSTKAQGG